MNVCRLVPLAAAVDDPAAVELEEARDCRTMTRAWWSMGVAAALAARRRVQREKRVVFILSVERKRGV